MRVHVLGTSAGGGLPQWNCGCPNCRGARDGSLAIRPRTQSSLCVSADGERWVLFNASPDVRTQLASFAPLAPRDRALRGSGVAAVVLTNADIDHCAGLLVLREGGAPPIYCTESVRTAITEGLRIVPALGAYGTVAWHPLNLGEESEVHGRDGAPTGVFVRPFAVASKPPPYMLPLLEGLDHSDLAGDTVGLRIRTADGATLAYVPGVRDLDEALRTQLADASAILIDGTFFTLDELPALGISTKNARTMGHAPLSGPGGTLEFLAQFPKARRVLVHINNTNPILVEESEARRAVERAGVEVGYDGLDFSV